MNGTNINEIPSYDKFYDKTLLWYEVDSLIDDTIFAEPSQTYQIRFPNKDINVRVKNLKTVNFSW